MKIKLTSENETKQFGAALFQAIRSPYLIFLQGNLGAGKTTLASGFIQASEYKGAVKSPTYTIVEEYQAHGKNIYHFDLYRLSDPEELEWIGFKDYLDSDSICLVEWPEKGTGFLPQPDLILLLTVCDEGRQVVINARNSEIGKALSTLQAKY
ncbi:MAG: tRNA (adenosine(37)-N6)-threonylcarbamoyltransferase complex ATPase subunit type 1 TsaE [Methylococcaceae bacterium]